MTDISWLDDLHEARGMATSLRHEMLQIVRALKLVGNETLAAQLLEWVRDIQEIEDRLKSGASGSVSEMMTASDQATQNMLGALCAGLTLATSDPEMKAAVASFAGDVLERPVTPGPWKIGDTLNQP